MKHRVRKHAEGQQRAANRTRSTATVQPLGMAAFLLQLQRTHGNRLVQRLLARTQRMEGEAAIAPEVEDMIRQASGRGLALDDAVRANMEAAFGADFSGVHVHVDTEADQLNRALEARAFTVGQDIFFRAGQYEPSSPQSRSLLAHELTHVVQQVGGTIGRQLEVSQPGDREEQEADAVARSVSALETGLPKASEGELPLPLQPLNPPLLSLKILRDLAREAPGRLAEPVPLSEAEVTDAITFNAALYRPNSIRVIQDIIGAAETGTFDEDTIHMVVEWQADFRLTTDGKVGLRTLKTIVQELISEGSRNGAIWLIIDGHNIPTAGLDSIRFDATLTGANAETAGPIPGNSTVRIGPPAFAQGYEGLVHTLAHELEHVRQRRVGIANQDEREFLGEAVEIVSVGMLQERLAGFMDDARRALFHFNNLPAADQTRLGARFNEVRAQVRRRFNAASAADQATHQATMDAYNAIVLPAGP